jgi:hypothetical protein
MTRTRTRRITNTSTNTNTRQPTRSRPRLRALRRPRALPPDHAARPLLAHASSLAPRSHLAYVAGREEPTTPLERRSGVCPPARPASSPHAEPEPIHEAAPPNTTPPTERRAAPCAGRRTRARTTPHGSAPAPTTSRNAKGPPERRPVSRKEGGCYKIRTCDLRLRRPTLYPAELSIPLDRRVYPMRRAPARRAAACVRQSRRSSTEHAAPA